MAVKGNWGVEIVDTLHVYEMPKKYRGYLHETLGDYKTGCGC